MTTERHKWQIDDYFKKIEKRFTLDYEPEVDDYLAQVEKELKKEQKAKMKLNNKRN